MKALAVVTSILLVLTIGCGFAIHFCGEAFRSGIRGHMVLGLLTLVSLAVLVAMVLKS